MASFTRMPAGWGRVHKFEILWSIVVADAVAVVHGLAVQEIPSEKALRHECEFEYIGMLSYSGMSRDPHDHVAGLVA